MKTKYICRECGEDLPGLEVTAKISNIQTVDELIHHFDPCNCKYHDEDEHIDKIYELEQENKRLRARLMNIEEGVSRVGEFVAKENRTDNTNYLTFDHQREIYILVRWDGAEMAAAPTMPDLIDTVLTEVE